MFFDLDRYASTERMTQRDTNERYLLRIVLARSRHNPAAPAQYLCRRGA